MHDQTTHRIPFSPLAKSVATWSLALGLGVSSFVYVVIPCFRYETGIFIGAVVLFVVAAIYCSPFVAVAGELIGWFACRYSDNRRIQIILLSLAVSLIVDFVCVGWMIVLFEYASSRLFLGP